MTLVVKVPSECSDAEINAFFQLVREGEEVDPTGLFGRIKKAAALAFLYIDCKLAGVGALKNPNAGYKARSFTKAGVQKMAEAFSLEVGWVFVSEGYRGRKLSRPLVEALLGRAPLENVFATSRTDNKPIHRTLERYGFVRAGQPYRSGRGNYNLQLYLHTTAQPSTAVDAPKAACQLP